MFTVPVNGTPSVDLPSTARLINRLVCSSMAFILLKISGFSLMLAANTSIVAHLRSVAIGSLPPLSSLGVLIGAFEQDTAANKIAVSVKLLKIFFIIIY